jgi:hypothetical protein
LMAVHIDIAGKTVAIGKVVNFTKIAGTQNWRQHSWCAAPPGCQFHYLWYLHSQAPMMETIIKAAVLWD